MAYKRGDREQITMLPPTIGEYVAEDDPVRAYDAFVEALNLEQLGIEDEEDKVGNSAYEPKTMLKILVYGYSYGWRSSRKLERALKEKVQAIMEKIRKEERTQLNAVDEDCVKVRGRQGAHAGYNAQIAVDERHGLIVSSDVVSESNDAKQFSEQVRRANEALGRKCKTACADAGYANAGNLKGAVEEGIEVIVPRQKQALHEPRKDDPFGKDKFLYDKENNRYLCPAGKALKYSQWRGRRTVLGVNITASARITRGGVP